MPKPKTKTLAIPVITCPDCEAVMTVDDETYKGRDRFICGACQYEFNVDEAKYTEAYTTPTF